MYCRRLEICRLLFQHGAQLEHVSTFGWSPLVYLFEGVRVGPGVREIHMLDFLDLLDQDHMILDLDVLDTKGEDALQHAARASTGDVLQWLIRSGSSLERYGVEPWQAHDNPMRLAIIAGNMSAFHALLPLYPVHVDEEDDFGYTMLDYAARRGHGDMIRLLLQLGAEETLPEDWEAQPASADVIDSDGLVAWSAESHRTYLSVLEDLKRIVIMHDEEDGSKDVDIFWDANEDNSHLA